MDTLQKPEVWIIGSSIIARLYRYMRAHGLDDTVCLPCTVTWDGRGGRQWEQLMPLIRSTTAPPDILVVSLGGNSLGGRTRVELLQSMKEDVSEIQWLFPGTLIFFSDILPRWNWRSQTATYGYGLERSRRWINGAMAGFMADKNCGVIPHSNIHLNHLGNYGVHLNPEGNKTLLNNIHEALHDALQQ